MGCFVNQRIIFDLRLHRGSLNPVLGLVQAAFQQWVVVMRFTLILMPMTFILMMASMSMPMPMMVIIVMHRLKHLLESLGQ